MENLKLLKGALDPETFLSQHRDRAPDLVLVHLDGLAVVPDWLSPLIDQLPLSEVVVCSECRDPDFLIRIMKLRVGGFMPLPLNREEFLATLNRVRLDREKVHAMSKGQILAVTGTKGGVGTTSIATNLALALNEFTPGEVILVDLARPFPHVGQFLDLKGSHSFKDLVDSANTLDPMFLKKIVHRHDSKLEVLVSYPDYNLRTDSLPDAKALGKIFATLRASYNWVVVDLGSWLDLFYIQVLEEADQYLLVTELTIPDMQNLKIIKSLFRDWDLDESKAKVIVNRYIKDYTLVLKDLENIFARPVLCTLPHEHPTLVEAINQGVPLGEIAPRSRLWRKLKGLAGDLVAQSEPEPEKSLGARPGLLRKIFS